MQKQFDKKWLEIIKKSSKKIKHYYEMDEYDCRKLQARGRLLSLGVRYGTIRIE